MKWGCQMSVACVRRLAGTDDIEGTLCNGRSQAGRYNKRFSRDGIREPSRLLLNYECEQGGSVRISLEDVPGRTEENSIPLTGSSFDAVATWSDGDVLAPRPEGQSVKVTLHMDRASVYAYQIVPVE